MPVCKIIGLLFLGVLLNIPCFSGHILTDSTCIRDIKVNRVTGNSLSGVVESGENLKIFVGIYDCNEVKREDIVVYHFSGSPIPLVKLVKGLPNDTFKIECIDNKCYININGNKVRNFSGGLYYIVEKESSLLKYYEKSFRGIIPEDTFMILGSHNGTVDSSKFGLISKKDLLGKAELMK